jgi:hypothetical protein
VIDASKIIERMKTQAMISVVRHPDPSAGGIGGCMMIMVGERGRIIDAMIKPMTMITKMASGDRVEVAMTASFFR